MLRSTCESASNMFDLGIPEACAGAASTRLTACAGGLGGGVPTQRGVRGAAPARSPDERSVTSGEREGQRPLACAQRTCRIGKMEREGQRPLSILTSVASPAGGCGGPRPPASMWQ
jgi:hypothetical protein